jgi:hypothetical protein
VSDAEQPELPEQQEQPLRRPRGRHAQPKARAATLAGWRARIVAAVAPLTAWAEPRISSAGAWLYERRLHVLIVSATVATIGMLGGAVALISFAGAPQPGDEASTVVDETRPSSTDPASPNTYAPILPSPGPTPSIKPGTPTPTPTPLPDEVPDDPTATMPAEPTTEPTADPDGRPDPPGQTNKPDKPKG